MEEYALQQIQEQTSGNVEKWIEELKLKYDNEKYYYDENEAIKFYQFIGKLELDKGVKGAKIKLLKFQFDICTSIICVKKRIDGLRRFRECHINVPRKNGKGFIIACIITYLYYCKNEFGSRVIITANTTAQAGELFETIKFMIDHNKALRKYVKIRSSRRIIEKKNMNSTLMVISSDASNADSYAGLFCVLDEIHEAPNGKLYDKLRTGMGIWQEPLLITLTTTSSGKDPNNLELELYNYAKSIESGETQDESFFYAIYEADKGCSILDEKQWFKSNPALGTFRQYEDIKSLALRASRLKTREPAFRRLYLNQHVALDGEGAINIDLWRKSVKDITLDDFKGFPCYCGMDMSATQDITAFVIVCYNPELNKFLVYPMLFTPENTLLDRSERDNVRYDVFVKLGDLIALKGNHINFEEMYEHIKKIQDQIEIDEIDFDAWGSIGIISKLEDKFKVVKISQQTRYMHPIIVDFENLLLDGRLIIAKNSAFEWMAGNVVAIENSNGYVRYDKAKSKNKIDGIIAMLMGLSRAIYNADSLDLNSLLTDDYLENLGW